MEKKTERKGKRMREEEGRRHFTFCRENLMMKKEEGKKETLSTEVER